MQWEGGFDLGSHRPRLSTGRQGELARKAQIAPLVTPRVFFRRVRKRLKRREMKLTRTAKERQESGRGLRGVPPLRGGLDGYPKKGVAGGANQIYQNKGAL